MTHEGKRQKAKGMTLNPELHSFDIYHVGVSGGKDSTALLLWARFESGIDLDKLDVSFCDTGNEDALTYAYLDLLRSIIAPVPINVIHPELDFYELAHHKGRFPAAKSRFCTVELKIVPTREHVMGLMRQGNNVLVMNGVRRAEGKAGNTRADAAAWEYDALGWGTWIHRPIVDWSIDLVWEVHQFYIPMTKVVQLIQNDPNLSDDNKALISAKLVERTIPCNPLYAMGASRVGCYPCVMARKGEMRSMAKYRPERLDFIEREELTGFTHASQGISTFFRRAMVPEHLRSQAVTRKAGDVVMVPTIRDVADWAQTARGGKQYDMDFDDPPASACDIGGMCE